MTREFAEERIKKAQEIIEKKTKTIEKKTKSIEKKIAELAKLGYTYEGREMHPSELQALGMTRETANDASWITYDIENLKDDIERGQKEIKEKQESLEKYQKALEEIAQTEKIIANDIPEAMKQARAELVERWTRYDLEEQAQMLKDRAEMEWKEFSKKWSYSARERLYKSEEDFRRENERESTIWMLDLYNRVKDITGDIIDASDIRWGGKALNGWIKGKNGNARVETIGAGGYNIQRFHLRVLVHKS